MSGMPQPNEAASLRADECIASARRMLAEGNARGALEMLREARRISPWREDVGDLAAIAALAQAQLITGRRGAAPAHTAPIAPAPQATRYAAASAAPAHHAAPAAAPAPASNPAMASRAAAQEFPSVAPVEEELDFAGLGAALGYPTAGEAQALGAGMASVGHAPGAAVPVSAPAAAAPQPVRVAGMGPAMGPGYGAAQQAAPSIPANVGLEAMYSAEEFREARRRGAAVAGQDRAPNGGLNPDHGYGSMGRPSWGAVVALAGVAALVLVVSVALLRHEGKDSKLAANAGASTEVETAAADDGKLVPVESSSASGSKSRANSALPAALKAELDKVRAELGEGRPRDAAVRLEEALKKYPSESTRLKKALGEAYTDIGTAALEKKSWTNALEAFEKAIAVGKSDGEVQVGLAKSHQELAKRAQAEKKTREAATHLEKATKALRAAIDKNPGTQLARDAEKQLASLSGNANSKKTETAKSR